MKRVKILAIIIVTLVVLGGCNFETSTTTETEFEEYEQQEEVAEKEESYSIDYKDAESFEKALNAGKSVKGKIVCFDVIKYKPNSALGINCWSGEHLNFISQEELDVEEGNLVIGCVTKEPKQTILDSWEIYYEVLKILPKGSQIEKDEAKEETSNRTDIENELKKGSYKFQNIKNFSFAIPKYWEEEGSKNEYFQYYAQKGEKVVMLSIGYPKETDKNYDVSFEGLYDDNENMIDAIEYMFTDGDVFDYEIFESDYGVKGILYQFTYNQKIDWFEEVDGRGYCFCFPSEDDRRWFYVTLLHTNNVASDEYKDDYMKMISAIKEKSK